MKMMKHDWPSECDKCLVLPSPYCLLNRNKKNLLGPIIIQSKKWLQSNYECTCYKITRTDKQIMHELTGKGENAQADYTLPQKNTFLKSRVLKNEGVKWKVGDAPYPPFRNSNKWQRFLE